MTTYTIQYLTSNVSKQDKISVVTESTTMRTLALTDASKYIRCTNSSSTFITVPPQSSVAWIASTRILVEMSGTGEVVIEPGSGVTLNDSAGLTATVQFSYLELFRTSSNVWTVTLLPGTGSGSSTVTNAYVAKTGAYTLTALDGIVECTSGTFALTLETAVGCAGREHTLANSGTGIISINTTSSQTVHGYASGELTILEGVSYTVYSNGTNWRIK